MPMIPMTRPISLVIHEQAYEALRSLAEETTRGSVSRYIRLQIYKSLIEQRKLPMSFIEELYKKGA